LSNKEKIKIGVIGAGSWGTTLANHLIRKGHCVTLWVYEKELCEIILKERRNPIYLPDILIEKDILPTNSIEEACNNKDIIIFVVPSHVIRGVIKKAVPFINKGIVISATKGIENKSLLTTSQILKELLPERMHKKISVLSGPSFAREVAIGLPTAVAVASEEIGVAQYIQGLFSTPFFRIYTNSDVIGTELGGALKNVIAIAVGISDGLGLGNNARAALITRGIAEMIRLGTKLGANPITFSGLAGFGDLVLTCTSDLSRNRTVGLKLGQGMNLREVLQDMKMVAEGVKTTKAVFELAKRHDVEMPITEQVYKVLYKGKSPYDAVKTLLSRNLRDEFD
jgi:glycerol-3-phosphate dehydrogenase (NAD(P)+)